MFFKKSIRKVHYESDALQDEIPYINDKREDIYKEYYESGALLVEVILKDNKLEGVMKLYNENESLYAQIIYKNNKAISGKCGNGRQWNNAEISNWNNGLPVNCNN